MLTDYLVTGHSIAWMFPGCSSAAAQDGRRDLESSSNDFESNSPTDVGVHCTRKFAGVARPHQQIDFIRKQKDYAQTRIRLRESQNQLATEIDCG
jgi:hypothetical protein